ncbi:hypothetical protein AGDE_16265 [Angomonas deanei]|nr:hypothetical protein AGDE_16265 [Angomonas deanei]|eukprot:EPY17410.1 hypothetical protein AGDE_16265 [Angomonas deanei]
MVCTPRLCSREAHSIKLLLWFPQNHPIGIFLTTQSSLSVNLEYARMPFLRDRLLSRSGLVSLSLTVLVDLMSGTVSAQCDSGTVCLYENMFRHGHSDLQLSFVLSAPGSTVEVASWGVLNLGESAAVQRQPVMDAVSRLSETGAVSFNYAPTTGTIIRHSVRDSHGAFMKESNGSCAKQMEFLLLSYSRLLLGKALFSQEKARESVADRLHKCLSYTSLTGVSSLSNILDSESRKRSHCLLSQCFAYLLLPDVLQETAGVSTSLTILDAVITDPGSFLLSATEFSTALILVLLRTATVQFRSTRHLALTCVQKLVSNPPFAYRAPPCSWTTFVQFSR